jgi:nicotinate dehydrogenase subunit A
MKMTLNVNGKPAAITADDPQMPLLYALRDDLGLHGPRFGCGLGQCGACTVLVDGKAMRSCVMPVATMAGKKIVTLEGLGGPAQLHPLQRAFIDEQAVQCGYCINGMIMQAAALLHGHRAAAVSAYPPTEAHRRSTVRDRVSRFRRGGVCVNVRLIH